jgi:hypothetical protein
MEVREIVETVIKDPLLEVRFRMSTDTDEVIRIAEFDLQEIEDYGYNVITEDFDLFEKWVNKKVKLRHLAVEEKVILQLPNGKQELKEVPLIHLVIQNGKILTQ